MLIDDLLSQSFDKLTFKYTSLSEIVHLLKKHLLMSEARKEEIKKFTDNPIR